MYSRRSKSQSEICVQERAVTATRREQNPQMESNVRPASILIFFVLIVSGMLEKKEIKSLI